MERWAKKMNTATEAKKTAVKQAQDELRALEQKEEELRKQIVQEKAVTGILGQVAANKVLMLLSLLTLYFLSLFCAPYCYFVLPCP